MPLQLKRRGVELRLVLGGAKDAARKADPSGIPFTRNG